MKELTHKIFCTKASSTTTQWLYSTELWYKNQCL